ncbi:MAG: hypothetical protein RL094_120 [Candidatus Parcubacteria bacterium]|jgi:dTMP kinase
MKPKFIIIEGGEGAGKGTAIAIAKALLGESMVFTREPGGSPLAEKIRTLSLDTEEGKQANAKTQFGLVWAARADHMKNTVIPALKAGKHVVCDRFDSSTWTYQICGQEDSELKALFFDTRRVYLGEHAPDLYIYLDVDPVIGLQRRNAAGDLNHFDTKPLDFHQRVRAGYQEFMTRVPSVTIDASQSMADVEQEFRRVLTQFIEGSLIVETPAIRNN